MVCSSVLLTLALGTADYEIESWCRGKGKKPVSASILAIFHCDSTYLIRLLDNISEIIYFNVYGKIYAHSC